MTPERNLWAAVLAQAIDDATGGKLAYGEPKDRDHARAWIESGCKDYRMVCDGAGVDPDWVRYHALRRRHPPKPGETAPKVPWTSRELARARRLREIGKSYDEIGRLINRPGSTVRDKLVAAMQS